MTRHLIAASVWLCAAGAVTAHAQALWALPSLATRVLYDSNVYHRSAAESDLLTRVSPRLDVLRRRERLTMSGRLELDADRFARHPGLSTDRSREAAAVDMRYAASPRLSVSSAAAFTATDSPDELNELAALSPGRARARRLLWHPSVGYDLGPRASLALGYLVTGDALHGGVGGTTETVSASLARHLSARDGLALEYLEQHFSFTGAPASASRAVTVEWSRQVDRGTTVTLRVGPRVADGALAPELSALLRRALQAGSVSLSYQDTETTLIGLAGSARMRSLGAGFERVVGRRLTLRTTSALVQTRQAELRSVAYRVSGGCNWRFAPRLGVEASYDSDLQRGDLYASQPAQVIRRNLFSVSLVVADARAAAQGR
jgi:hypothetical protein